MKNKKFLIGSIVAITAICILGYMFNSRGKVAGTNTETEIKGLILPHHDLAKELIHSSITRVVEKNKPSVVVLLGPNHYYPGIRYLVTGFPQDYNYAREYTQQFQSELPGVIRDDEIVYNEHSIMTILPYLKEYVPSAQVVPLIIPGNIDEKNINDRAQFLANSLPEDTLYIAAVDFSHESFLSLGLEKNDESIEAISSFDYKTIYEYQDDHLDSPVSIALLLKIMEYRQAQNWETWHSSHGAMLVDDLALRGTSYVIGVFR